MCRDVLCWRPRSRLRARPLGPWSAERDGGRDQQGAVGNGANSPTSVEVQGKDDWILYV